MTARTAGRKGRPYRRARERMFAEKGTVCWLCLHDGAGDLDHVDGDRYNNNPSNHMPAHGVFSRCPVCGRACNQSRGTGKPRPAAVGNTSRAW